MNTIDFDRRTVLMLVGVLVAAVAATAFFTRRPAPAQPVAEPAVSTVSATSPAPSTGRPSPTGEVVVEVVGKVRDPQVLTLPKGSRVVDAVDAAGGARPGVDTSDQNLARVLVDGEQIRIGLTAPPAEQPVSPVPGSSGTNGSPIDINAASASELEEIPGVGPVLAQRIIAYRDQNGGFSSVEQLMEVSGIGEATFAQMQSMVSVGSGG